MNHEWLFLKMRSSNDLLGDPTALRERMAEDSYLYFHRVLDPQKVLGLRQAILEVLARKGWIKGFLSLQAGMAICRPVHESMAEYAPTYDAIQRLEKFHSLAHDPDLLAIMGQVLGETAFPHPLKICRLGFPEHYEASTPPHQDFPNNQGTESLTAAWIPVGDVPMDLGGVAILRGSHRWGLLPLPPTWAQVAARPRCLNACSRSCDGSPPTTPAATSFCFPSLTVHAALHNVTEFDLRISVDYRYQLEGQPLTDICLHPHFQRVTWEEVYRGWKSDRYQYYWKGLDYQVVPFEDFPVDRGSREGGRRVGYTPDEWVTIMTVDKRWEARYQRRLERLAEVTGEQIAPEVTTGEEEG